MHLPEAIAGRRAVLVTAHPGHELRLHGWLEQARPEVWVVTDGSGHAERGRLASTIQVLDRAGASRGSLFGRFSDRDGYELLMRGDVAAVYSLVDELAVALVAKRIDYVAGDACEGFNPVHDLCRLVVDSAVLLARRRGHGAIEDYEFSLAGGPDWRGDGEELCWVLDDDALQRKLAAARDYPELAAEVESALLAHGADAFRRERLYRVEPLATLRRRLAGQPQYERFGEERVAAGHYTRVLRLREHFVPFADRLVTLVESS